MPTIKISTFSEDSQLLPIVPLAIYEHLEEVYKIDNLLHDPHPKSNDERIGYIRGVREVVNKIRLLTHIDDEKE